MGTPAARLGDLAGHAGVIVYGTPRVLIGGMPAARVGDPLACPGFDGPKPHVMGNIVMGSFSVMIDNSFAARQGDLTGCGIAGIVGFNMPPIVGPPIPVPPIPAPAIPEPSPDNTVTGVLVGVIGDEQGALVGKHTKEIPKNSAGVLWGQAKEYHNVVGVRGEVEGSLIHAGGELSGKYGKVAGSIDEGNVAGEAHIGLGSIGVSGEASVMKASGEVSTNDKAVIYGGVAGEGKVLTAEAKADVLMGTDGRRTGIGLALGAEAATAKGDITGKGGLNIPIPFTNKTLTLGGNYKVGGVIGGIGASISAGLYHDKADDKIHASLGGDLAAIFGLGGDIDLMIGLVDDPLPVPDISASIPNVSGGMVGIGIPLTPGSIMFGCPTVLIG